MPGQKSYDDAVVGAGILGLAHAYQLARRGRRVIVFERNPRPSGPRSAISACSGRSVNRSGHCVDSPCEAFKSGWRCWSLRASGMSEPARCTWPITMTRHRSSASLPRSARGMASRSICSRPNRSVNGRLP